MNLASLKSQWPLGRGFERFYGFLGAETNQWYPDLVYDNHPVEQPSLPEDGYHFTRRHHRPSALLHPRRQGDRARQAVLPLLLPRRLPRARTTRPRSGPTSTRASSTWATRPTASTSSSGRRSSASSPTTPSCRRSTRTSTRRARTAQELAPARHRSALGLAHRRREAPVRAHGRGVRRLPEPRRPPDRAPARLPRGDAASSTTPSSCSCPTTARPARVARTAPSTRTSSSTASPTDRGEPAAARRARHPADVQPLPHRLGVGVQHAVQDVEALRATTKAASPTR